MKYWKIGNSKTILWNFTDVLSDVQIELSRDDTSSWTTITSATSNTGSYSWLVTGPETTSAVFRISGLIYTDPIDSSEIDFTDITSNSEVFGISLTKGSTSNIFGNITDPDGNVFSINATIVNFEIDGNILGMAYVDNSGNLKIVNSYLGASLGSGCSVQ